MQFVGRMFTSVTDLYKDINPSTLSGAVDIIVVESKGVDPETGLEKSTRRCSPFHVRFGKLQLLRPSEKRVEIAINKQVINAESSPLVDEVAMKVGESGETFFVIPAQDDGIPGDTHALLTSPLAKSIRDGIMAHKNEAKEVEQAVQDSEPQKAASDSEIETPSNVPLAHDSIAMQVENTSNVSLPMPSTVPVSAIDQRKPSISQPSTAPIITTTMNGNGNKSWNWPWSAASSRLQEDPLVTMNMSLPYRTADNEPIQSEFSCELFDFLELAPILRHNYAILKYLMGLGKPVDTKMYLLDRGLLLVDGKQPLTPKRLAEVITESGKLVPSPDHSATFEDLLTTFSMQGIAIAKDNAKMIAIMPADFAIYLLNHWILLGTLPPVEELFAMDNPWSIYPILPVHEPQPDMDGQLVQIAEQEKAALSDEQTTKIPLLPGPLASVPAIPAMPPKGVTWRQWWSSPKKRETTPQDKAPANQDVHLKTPEPKKPPSMLITQDGGEPSGLIAAREMEARRRYSKSLRLPSETLCKLPLKPGLNNITFTVSTRLQGRASCEARIFLFPSDVRLIISDVDGTITKSDALGHFFNMVGKDWTHPDVATLYTQIAANGYQLIYLTSRAIGQAGNTRAYLQGIVQQDGARLPEGPLIMSPDRLFTALRREVFVGNPEEFKIAALKDIARLFQVDHHPEGVTPFYAGFGNRNTDEAAYKSVLIPAWRIFTVNATGRVDLSHSRTMTRQSYGSLGDLVDSIFPPIRTSDAPGGGSSSSLPLPEYGDFLYWSSQGSDVCAKKTTGPHGDSMKLIASGQASHDTDMMAQTFADLGIVMLPKVQTGSTRNSSLMILPPEAIEALGGTGT